MYDPDQDPEERRQMRMQYRELWRKLNDNKNEYLQPHSDGIRRTFEQAEQLFKKVKQTSDATIDSRLLVQATDLALKKATNLTYGNSGATIDADEFVGQCIAFMRSNTHPRRPDAADEDDDAAADDAMDWAYLGRMAAFKGNKRPPTTDFLLGPLSVTKKIRIMKARRQGLRRDNANLVRPVEVTQEPGEKAESGSSAMSALVQKIYLDLKAWFRRNPGRAEKGLNLFRFVVNPNSFGQTVENMFYLSFLVKDGFIAISYDEENGLPVIHCTDPATQEDHKEFDITRNQVIFSITMWEWQEMKSIFDITESMIPTRAQEQVLTSATGWYS
ncbi:Nse4 C-terminal-domain-containing protein [Morchella snyderi]|nr:Nse4 C-terminal-domain-containing protein [Morchella snyderi]